MKKKYINLLKVLIGIFFLTTSILNAQENTIIYSKVRIDISSKKDITDLQSTGLGLDHIHSHEDYIEAILSNLQIEMLKSFLKMRKKAKKRYFIMRAGLLSLLNT